MMPVCFARRRTLRRLSTALFVTALGFSAWSRAEDPAPAAVPAASSTPAPAPAPAPTVADRLLVRTNAARQGMQLPPLKADPKLTAAARQLAEFMARTGAFSHQADGRTPDQRVSAQGYRWTYVSENIAFQSSLNRSSADQAAQAFLTQWWNSPGHRVNMLSRQVTHTGIATAVAPSGAMYAVQVFAAPAAAP